MRKQNSSPPKRACRSLDRCSSSGVARHTLLREEVVGPDLLAEQRGHALDDPVADRMAERVVVPLEPGDVDEADGAPASALLERQERLELLGEPREVHQLRLRVAMRLVGEVGDQRLEIPRDAADGRVLRRELGSDVRHLVGEPGGQRLNGFLLGFLPQPLVAGEHARRWRRGAPSRRPAPGGGARVPIPGGRSGFRATARGRSPVPVS